MASGKTTRHQVMEFTGITTERSMKENGLMITSTARVWRLGLTEANTMDITTRERKTEKESIHGKTTVITLALGRTTRSMDLVLMSGVMEGSTKDSG